MPPGRAGMGWDGCVRFHLFTLFCPILTAQRELLIYYSSFCSKYKTTSNSN